MWLKQKGLLCDRKGERANVTPYTQEAPLMRLSVASFATGGQGRSADRIRSTGSHLVRWPRTVAPLRVSARIEPATARGMRSGQQRLWRRAAGPAHHELVLCRRPPPGAVALPDGGSADCALLRPGAAAHLAHRSPLAEAVHPEHVGAARPAQSGAGVGRDHAPPAAAPHDRRRWHRRVYWRHRGLGISRLQSPSSETSQLLPAARPSRADRPHPAAQESSGQRA